MEVRGFSKSTVSDKNSCEVFTNHVERLQFEAVHSTAFRAVQIISKGENDLEKRQRYRDVALSTLVTWLIRNAGIFSRTSSICLTFADLRMELEAQMMAFSCYNNKQTNPIHNITHVSRDDLQLDHMSGVYLQAEAAGKSQESFR